MHAPQAVVGAAVCVSSAWWHGGPQDARPRLCTAGAPQMAMCATINNTQKLLWRLLENSVTLEIG